MGNTESNGTTNELKTSPDTLKLNVTKLQTTTQQLQSSSSQIEGATKKLQTVSKSLDTKTKTLETVSKSLADTTAKLTVETSKPVIPSNVSKPEPISKPVIPSKVDEKKEVKEENFLDDGIRTTTLFNPDIVKKLTKDHFTIEQKEKICLKIEDCLMVLFYLETEESRKVAKIWGQAAAKIVDNRFFCACNLTQEQDVRAALKALKSQPDHPFHWVSSNVDEPFILVYNQGWPKSFFIEEITVDNILKFKSESACVPNTQFRQKSKK